METTFEKFIANNPREKELFDEEYKQFHLSELLLEKTEEAKISIKTPAKESCLAARVVVRNVK
jgi:hypothetical protein